MGRGTVSFLRSGFDGSVGSYDGKGRFYWRRRARGLGNRKPAWSSYGAVRADKGRCANNLRPVLDYCGGDGAVKHGRNRSKTQTSSQSTQMHTLEPSTVIKWEANKEITDFI